MSLPEFELARHAYTRYAIFVIGGDAVYLQDCKLGHNLYLGSGKLLTKADLRKYINALNDDLRELSIQEFLEKHGYGEG